MTARAGTTLVELLVVLTILAVTSSLASVAFRRAGSTHDASTGDQVLALRREAIAAGHAITRIVRHGSTASVVTALADGRVQAVTTDNIILLGYQVDGSTVRHGIHILKARASRHDREVRELRIHDTGIEILDPMDVVASYNGGEVSPARGAPAR